MNMGLAGDVINYISHIFLLLASYEILLWNSMLDIGRKTKIKKEQKPSKNTKFPFLLLKNLSQQWS